MEKKILTISLIGFFTIVICSIVLLSKKQGSLQISEVKAEQVFDEILALPSRETQARLDKVEALLSKNEIADFLKKTYWKFYDHLEFKTWEAVFLKNHSFISENSDSKTLHILGSYFCINEFFLEPKTRCTLSKRFLKVIHPRHLLLQSIQHLRIDEARNLFSTFFSGRQGSCPGKASTSVDLYNVGIFFQIENNFKAADACFKEALKTAESRLKEILNLAIFENQLIEGGRGSELSKSVLPKKKEETSPNASLKSDLISVHILIAQGKFSKAKEEIKRLEKFIQDKGLYHFEQQLQYLEANMSIEPDNLPMPKTYESWLSFTFLKNLKKSTSNK